MNRTGSTNESINSQNEILTKLRIDSQMEYQLIISNISSNPNPKDKKSKKKRRRNYRTSTKNRK